MAWLACLICGITGAALAGFLGAWLTTVYRMSKFEGEAGFFVLFVLIPLGFLGGLIIGAITVWCTGKSGYLKMQGLALLMTVAVACAVAFVGYLVADHPPRIGGRKLLLEFELRLPKTFRPLEGQDQGGIHAALGDTLADPVPAYPQLNDARRDPDGALVVPGTVALLSHSSQRFLQGDFGLADGYYSFTFDLALPASPGSADEIWRRWITDRDAGDNASAATPPHERPTLRYRIQTIP